MRGKNAKLGEFKRQVYRELDEFFAKLTDNRQLMPEKKFLVVELSTNGSAVEREADRREEALMRFLKDVVAGRRTVRKLGAFKDLTFYFDGNNRGWSLVVCAHEEETLFTLNAESDGWVLRLVLTPRGKTCMESLASELEDKGLLSEFMEKK
ncbi:MAG: hypothetical protein QXG98_03780 [Candidatus Micrarchaeia archaeon]